MDRNYEFIPIGGLMDVSTLTLKELADLGLISKEMITRIQTRADRQIERLAQNHKLSDYIKRKK